MLNNVYIARNCFPVYTRAMYSEIWEPTFPEPREEYASIEGYSLKSPEFMESSEQRERAFHDAMVAFRQEVEYLRRQGDNHSKVPARLGQLLGRAYVRHYQTNVLRGATPERLRFLQGQLVATHPDKREGLMLLSGVVTEFGVLEAFKELEDSPDHPDLEGLEIYHPLSKEDVYGGTDLYLYLDGTAYAVQTKAIPTKEKKNNLLYPLDRERLPVEQVREFITPLLVEIDASPEAAGDLREVIMIKAECSAENLMKYTLQYDNVIPLFLAVASPNSEASLITSLGMPSEDLVDKLGQQLTLIHRERQQYLKRP